VKIVKQSENSKKIGYLSIIFFETNVLDFFPPEAPGHFPTIRYIRQGELLLIPGLASYQMAFLGLYF